MLKLLRSSTTNSLKLTKHQQEMEVLRAHHQKVMANRSLRQETLVGAGVLERRQDGKLAVSERYENVFVLAG